MYMLCTCLQKSVKVMYLLIVLISHIFSQTPACTLVHPPPTHHGQNVIKLAVLNKTVTCKWLPTESCQNVIKLYCILLSMHL